MPVWSTVNLDVSINIIFHSAYDSTEWTIEHPFLARNMKEKQFHSEKEVTVAALLTIYSMLNHLQQTYNVTWALTLG